MGLDLDAIKNRVQSLPHSECKWKREGWVVLDIRDRPVLESLSYLGREEVADFCVNAPEDIGLLLAEVERLQQVVAAVEETYLEALCKAQRERDEALARAEKDEVYL